MTIIEDAPTDEWRSGLLPNSPALGSTAEFAGARPGCGPGHCTADLRGRAAGLEVVQDRFLHDAPADGLDHRLDEQPDELVS
jgi:hypothetical protein